jgi:endonuclease/exonuclease/phosphatase family metal-dependent hydrolase
VVSLFRLSLLVALLAFALGGCRTPETGDALDAGVDSDPGYPDPRTDLVPPIGTPGALDIATWNIENFPRNAATPALVADLIASLDLDVVAVQEIEDLSAWEELLARLPDHDGVISTHTYSNGTFQKVGFIYRSAVVTVGEPARLFDNMGYEFPRPPLSVAVTAGSVDFELITLHLKAGRDFEDRERRDAAMIELEAHIADHVATIDEDVVVLGDFNEVITSTGGRAVFDPFLASGGYTLHTEQLAAEGRFSFVPSQAILDHVISTTALADELAGGEAQIPPLHIQLVNYENAVSDHLPVAVSMPIL